MYCIQNKNNVKENVVEKEHPKFIVVPLQSSRSFRIRATPKLVKKEREDKKGEEYFLRFHLFKLAIY